MILLGRLEELEVRWLLVELSSKGLPVLLGCPFFPMENI